MVERRGLFLARKLLGLISDLLTSGIASWARQEAYFFVRPQVTSV